MATDPGFTSLVVDASGLGSPTYAPASDLSTNSVYYWRVGAANACGASSWSAPQSFSTAAAPGECGLGSVATDHLNEDFEAGVGLWTHSGTGDTWALSTARPHSGANAFYAQDVATVSDQYLVSPPVNLAAGASSAFLSFWNHQTIEDAGAGACYDGGMVDISTDGGANWALLTPDPATDPYDGPISSSFSNPAAGINAWCGDPQDWTQTSVNLTAYAGQTVQFRFRMATDSSVSREGWYVDDVVVRSCVDELVEDLPFIDGFESGDTTAWSNYVP